MSSYSAQQSSISENNRSRILQYLYRNGISSRAQIAKAIELTPAAITKITAKLLFRDVIEETGDMEGDKNRRSIGLNLNCAKYHVVGVKFARSLVQIAVFDLKCNRISLTDLPTVDEEHIPETVEQIRATVRQLIADDSSIVAVGMAVPGPYLVEEGRTALVSSMQGWRQVNFIKEFSEAFNVPVFVEQDARAGALAQFLFNPELSEDRSPTICLARASASASSTMVRSITARTARPPKSDTSPLTSTASLATAAISGAWNVTAQPTQSTNGSTNSRALCPDARQ